MGAEANAVSVRGLSKSYGDVTAVEDVSFHVGHGRIAGFLGPNGAGKTTTLRMLLGLVRPTEGHALVLGSPYRELNRPLRRVGVALEGGAFVGGRNGRNHLRCFAELAGCDMRRVDELLELVDLTGAAGRPVGGYSTGMKQRLALATALLGDPDLLVLDEPANGLDPAGIIWLRELLRDLAGQGKTVLLSSHLLAELERTVDEVILIDQGRLVHTGTLKGLLHSDQCVVDVAHGSEEQTRALFAERGHESAVLASGRIWVDAGPRIADDIMRDSQTPDTDVQTERYGLESAFVRLTRANNESTS